MRGMGKRGFVAAIAVGLLTAACGGSGAVTAPNTPKQLAADKATAQAALLTATDFPAGYKGTPHDNSSSDDPPKSVQEKFVKCSGLPARFLDTSKNDQPHADAPDFHKGVIGRGAATEVDSSIEFDRSSKDISEPLSHLANAAKCFEPLFKSVFTAGQATTPGVTFGGISVTSLDPSTVGDQAAAFQGVVTISAQRVSLKVHFDLYFVRRGRAIITLTALGYGTTFDRVTAKTLLQTMVDRLDASK
jgi:hypothetical protein